MQGVLDDRQADGVPEISVLSYNQIQATTASNMENVVVSDSACLSEVNK